MPSGGLKTTFFNRFLFTISIRSRLLLYFIFLIMLPTSIISVTIYNKSTDIITHKINSSLEEKLNIIASNITQKFQAVNNTSSEIYLNSDLIRILSSQRPSDTTGIISEMSNMDKLLSNYTVTNNAQDLLLPRIYLFNRPEYLLHSFTNKVSDLSLIEKEKWYMQLPNRAEYTIVGLDEVVVSSVKIKTIKIAKRLFGLDDMSIKFSGVLTVDIGADYFNTILDQSKPTIGSSTFIIDVNKSIIISSDDTLLGTVFEPNKRDNILSAYERIEPLNWTLVSLTPMNELNGELIAFKKVIYTVIVVCGILALLMALFLSENISYPIRKLVKSMRVVQRGNFDITLEYKRNDEFAYLFHSYTKMVRDIKELIDKLYVSEVMKKEAELKALQAQINPHFLYNTLDSVNWMALELNATRISTMVTSLSNFFRYSLSKGETIISLREEKLQVESYLIIQKIRFQEKLDYSIYFASDILDNLTVKLILQPIVENAILHGINKIRGKGMIVITGSKSDSIIEIRVSDNGVGADIDELNSIVDNRSHSASFALKNVNERIKYYFGSEFGIRFCSNEDEGITVIVRFPAVKTMEGLYVNNDHSG
ncbi:histidine kinase [Paenibacillus baekrokdamisoli]|uniref:Histidine kinase n=2 Tax=Paenibacillus baekrokdamisoli TaxID=1712516 RepID=A0A3G9JH27_9BACL|nr:sensor histidine kinase [Paenibacillus baekrokdamisoli]MBB3073333.1 two-component system sensor histidine kinase YesM [Paenibacillus baekrokdamisoli]BBH22319.1 histidine kinase [Paenibacillus baekrokdamisoli]